MNKLNITFQMRDLVLTITLAYVGIYLLGCGEGNILLFINEVFCVCVCVCVYVCVCVCSNTMTNHMVYGHFG